MMRRSVTTETNEMSIELLFAYVGLEIAASIPKLNSLKDYWSTKTFYW